MFFVLFYCVNFLYYITIDVQRFMLLTYDSAVTLKRVVNVFEQSIQKSVRKWQNNCFFVRYDVERTGKSLTCKDCKRIMGNG